MARNPTTPTLTPLKSTALTGYHYDPDSRRLTVEFTSGKRWAYDDVPAEKVEAMQGAASPGGFFSGKIRGLFTGKELS